MGKVKDMTGQVFGRITVIRQDGYIAKQAAWLCRCLCGQEWRVRGNSLRNGDTKSCSCATRDRIASLNATHGLTKTPEYRSWAAMKTRCLNTGNHAYKLYGGRGITICSQWLNSFETFLRDMGPRPTAKHSLDRIDTNGNYEPENCRWATTSEQGRNRRKVKLGMEMAKAVRTLSSVGWKAPDLAIVLGVSESTIYLVLQGRTWTEKPT